MVLATAIGFALQLQAAAAGEIAYVPLSGPRGELMRQVERALPELAPAGVKLSRARLDAAAMERCIDDREFVDRVDQCIRALVPPPGRDGPVVVLWIDVQTISSRDGRRRHYRHGLRCIGQRSLATASLGDHATPAGGFNRDRAASGIRACLATAMTPRNAAALGRDARTGAPLWRLPLTRYPPDNAAHADGLSSERALIEVEQVRRRPAQQGSPCLLRARVRAVDGYYFLRQGDVIEVEAPCVGEWHAAFDRVVAPGIRPGSRARIHVDSDGSLRFVEPL